MPFEWYGSFWRLLKMRSVFSSNGISCRPSRRIFFSARMRFRRDGIESGSILSGHSPSKPQRIALSVPCPRPVSASEPKSSQRTRLTDARMPGSTSQRSQKRAAARIGPTVCEDDGPMPILNRSKTLTAMVYRRWGLVRAILRLPADLVGMTMRLILYQRDDCHLCDLALDVLAQARVPDFDSVFIDDNIELE